MIVEQPAIFIRVRDTLGIAKGILTLRVFGLRPGCLRPNEAISGGSARTVQIELSRYLSRTDPPFFHRARPISGRRHSRHVTSATFRALRQGSSNEQPRSRSQPSRSRGSNNSTGGTRAARRQEHRVRPWAKMSVLLRTPICTGMFLVRHRTLLFLVPQQVLEISLDIRPLCSGPVSGNVREYAATISAARPLQGLRERQPQGPWGQVLGNENPRVSDSDRAYEPRSSSRRAWSGSSVGKQHVFAKNIGPGQPV